jgi:LPXTG-motif cell wall-anchored protein
MQLKPWAASILFVGALALAGGGANAAAPCVPEPVSALDFVVDGEVDLAAYLAAVAAANAACAPSGGLPRTGANTSTLVPLAMGLTALGGAAVATTAVRRRALSQQ